MGKLPTPDQLGTRDPQPSTGVATYNPNVLDSAAPGLATAKVAGQLTNELDHYVAIEQEKDDTTRVEDAWNKYKSAAVDMTAGEQGVLNTKGGDAVNGKLLETVDTRLTDTRKTVLESLTNADQRRRFTERANATDLQVKTQVLSHVATERQTYAATVMQGQESAARVQVGLDPSSDQNFDQTKQLLERQAGTFMDLRGIKDKDARQQYLDKLNDNLWTTRIDKLLYNMPELAEAKFRGAAENIVDPQVRLTYQARTREVALGVISTQDATKIINEVRVAEGERVYAQLAPGTRDKELALLNVALQKDPNNVDLQQAKYAVENNVTKENTTGLPNSRDIAAQLPLAMGRVEKMANARYGDNPGNPDRAAYISKTQAAVTARIQQDVQQLNAVQEQATGKLLDAVAGIGADGPIGAGGTQTVSQGGQPGAGRMKLTNFSQIQANPELMAAYQKMDYKQKILVQNALDSNQKKDEVGDPSLYNELRNRIVLPPNDPNKINWIQSIWQDPRVQAGKLNIAQMNSLRTLLTEDATDDGRSQQAVKKSGETLVKSMFEGDMVLTEAGTNKGKAAYAQALWAMNADRMIGLYKQQGKPINELFDPTPGAKNSLVTPEAIAQFKTMAGSATSTAGALSNAAKNAQPPAPPPAAVPAGIDTKDKLDAWIKTLPPNVDRFTDPGGTVRMISGRTAQPAPGPSSAAPAAAPAVAGAPRPAPPGSIVMDANGQIVQLPAVSDYGNRPDGTQKGNGFLGPLERPDGRVSTELSIGVPVKGKEMDIPLLVPTLTKPEVDHLLQSPDGAPPKKGVDKVFDGIVDKAIAHAEKRLAAGKSVFAGPDESPKAAAKAAVDDIPTLVEGPALPKGARTEEQKIAAAARLEDVLGKAVKSGILQSLGPVAMVADAVGAEQGMRIVKRAAGEFVQFIKGLSPSEEERSVTGFRALVKQGTFRANEDTVVLLNNFLVSKKGTEAENTKAAKMLKVIADKLGIETTPPDANSGGGGGRGTMTKAEADAAAQSGIFDDNDRMEQEKRKAAAQPAAAGYKTGTDDKRGTVTDAQEQQLRGFLQQRGMSASQIDAEVKRLKKR